MADNLLPIGTCLEQIENAVYGREVRKAIHDGIAQCYDDTVEGVNAAQQAASDTQKLINNMTAATTRANNAAAAAEKVNATASKVQDGPYQITVTNSHGTSATIEIPDPAAEIKKKANLEAVTVKKTVGPAEMVSFEDGVDAPAVLTKIKLEPKQDLHGYDHPWVGGAGKNLFDTVAAFTNENNGLTYTFDGTDRIQVSGTSTASNADSGNMTLRRGGVATPITIAQGTTFTVSLSGHPTTPTFRVLLKDANGDTLHYSDSTNCTWTYTAENDEEIARIMFRGRVANAVYNIDAHIQIEIGDTATDYEPYSNICPIGGYDAVKVMDAAKNILDLTELLNAPSGSIPGETYNFTHLLKLPVKKNTQYTLSTNYTYTNGINLNVLYFNTSKSSGLVNSAATRTANSGEDGVLYIGFIEREGYLEFVNGSAHAQLEEGSSATEYAAYNGSTMSISLASAGTVYGGELTLNEDGSGTVVADWFGHVFDGNEDWICNRSGVPFFRTSTDANGNHYPGYILIANSAPDGTITSKCSHYIQSTVTTTSKSMAKFYIYHSGSNDYPFIQFRPIDADAYSTDVFEGSEEAKEAWIRVIKEWYDAGRPLTIAYKMLTPISYALTATQIQTLVGTNHVWTDAGEITLTYRSDKYAELERRLSQLEALVLEN